MSYASIGSVVMGLLVGTNAAWAAPVQPAHVLLAGVVGQSNGDAASKRSECLDLVSRARQALEDGDLQTCESLLERAEALNVKFSPFYPGDTPKRVRRDLQRKRQKGAADSSSTGSETASSPSGDPFARRRSANDAATPGRQRQPQAAPTDQQAPPIAAGENPPVRGRNGNRQPARNAGELLLAARRALALGDARRAAALADEADKLGANYGPHDDTPARVRDLISRHAELSAVPPQDRKQSAYRRRYAEYLLDQAQGLLAWQDLDEAERLAHDAEALGASFGPYDVQPATILEEVARRRESAAVPLEPLPPLEESGVMPASAEQPIPTSGGADEEGYAAEQALYDRTRDRTRNVPARAEEAEQVTDAMRLVLDAQEALRAGDREAAYELLRQASQRRDELDPATWQRVQDQLGLLSQQRGGAGNRESLLDETAARQQALARKASAEVARRESEARRVSEVDPERALEILKEARVEVERAGLDTASRDVLLRRVDRSIAELQQYIATNRPRLDLAARNRSVEQEIERERQHRVAVQEKLAQMVEEFNKLMEEQRWAEAEAVAKRAADLMPEEPVVVQMREQSKVVRRLRQELEIRAEKEAGFVGALASVDQAATPFDDRTPILYPNARAWEDLTRSRRQMRARMEGRRSEAELEIERKLKTPVSLQFQDAPLSTVIEQLGKLAEINVYLDARGLAEEGVTADTPVTINLNQEISLKSALNLILQPLSLSYVIKHDVLKITSEHLRDTEVYYKTYNVADLVVPIPNFVPSGTTGAAGAFFNTLGGPQIWGATQSPLGVMAGQPPTPGADRNVLAQMNPGALNPAGNTSQPIGFGPGGLGGGVQPDFDSLIDLITTTVHPTTWAEVGGPSSIEKFEGNLSLVISTTQEVHEDIAELLDQLRRLQDLQVTIEVRFITLNDNFFERIGIDFDFNINDNVDRPFQIFGRRQNTDLIFSQPPAANVGPARDVQDRDLRRNNSVTVGMSSPGVFSADLDIPFTQGSFPLAVPQFGGFQPGSGSQIGFAILSDLETFFFIEAAQGDRRSNVLQAPKVTLFNGQSALVQDISISPFVVAVIPVVGDFAAAQMPVIAVIAEGSHLTVQAVISNDRRYVRLTVVPFFSRIGRVNTFTFTGSSTTIEESDDDSNQDDKQKRNRRRREETREGTTVQQPTVALFSVTTTVSVPDGGTVLLGGIKRLAEGRNEFGTPILNKIPYINRLFRNVGIGRETQSLMMMVTPRIIIQEEEEELLLGAPPQP